MGAERLRRPFGGVLPQVAHRGDSAPGRGDPSVSSTRNVPSCRISSLLRASRHTKRIEMDGCEKERVGGVEGVHDRVPWCSMRCQSPVSRVSAPKRSEAISKATKKSVANAIPMMISFRAEPCIDHRNYALSCPTNNLTNPHAAFD